MSCATHHLAALAPSRCGVDLRAEGAEGPVEGEPPPLLTHPVKLCSVDLYSLPPPPPPGKVIARGEAVTRASACGVGRVPTAVVSWFEAVLLGRAGVMLSSAPDSQTHWRQTAYPLDAHAGLALEADEVLRIRYRVDDEGLEVVDVSS